MKNLFGEEVEVPEERNPDQWTVKERSPWPKHLYAYGINGDLEKESEDQPVNDPDQLKLF